MIPIPDDYFEVESCIYKLSYGNKYVIVKGKTLTGSIYLIERGYAAFIAAGGGTGMKHGGQGQKEWEDKNSYYGNFYNYIRKHPKLLFSIEIILESNNGLELLKLEQSELNRCMKDKKMMNNNIEAYIPKFRESTQSYGWISADDVSAFKDFIAA